MNLDQEKMEAAIREALACGKLVSASIQPSAQPIHHLKAAVAVVIQAAVTIALEERGAAAVMGEPGEDFEEIMTGMGLGVAHVLHSNDMMCSAFEVFHELYHVADLDENVVRVERFATVAAGARA